MSIQKPPPPVIESLALRRATVVDANKIRYRVYTSHSEFVSVIAESALMAVRSSGVAAPYKVVRDLLEDNGVIVAEKIQKSSAEDTQTDLSLDANERLTQYFTELAEVPEEESVLFVPMGVAELQNKGMARARILPAEMLYEIIDAHQKTLSEASAAPIETGTEEDFATAITETAHDAAEAALTEGEIELEALLKQPSAATPAEPEISQRDKVLQMADELLPPATMQPAPEPAHEVILSQEEVEQLINE